jgi:diaminohydroxyphosphoribosylaminopyrimidine deaminase/5-amino-6-(5-phosphoribosylamino)uracil reductase
MDLSEDLHFFDQAVPTYRIIEGQSEQQAVIGLPEISPRAILEKLLEKNIHSIIIEGGTKTLQQFIDAELWDEARVFVGVAEFGQGIVAPQLNHIPNKTQKIFGDLLHYYFI